MRPRLSTVCEYCITVNWRTCDSVTLIERQPRQAAMSEPPLVIDVVDNGGQWTHREWRMLRYLGVDTQIIENTNPPPILGNSTASFYPGVQQGWALLVSWATAELISTWTSPYWASVQAINSWPAIMGGCGRSS